MFHPRLLLAALVALAGGLALLPPSAAAGAPASPTLDRIRHTGTITFAYREGAAPFSFKEHGNKVHGYSAELCERVAAAIQKELALPALKIVWLPVDSASRIAAVATGKADTECGTTSVTLSRMQSVDFSLPIYVDGGSILVRSASKLAHLADFRGKKIAVQPATTTERALRRALDALGASATLVPVKDSDAGMSLLSRGGVDGYASDRVLLAGLRIAAPNGADYTLIDGDFSVEPYALVVPRNDAEYRLAVNRALVALFRSGEIDAIFQRWLGGLGQPGPLLHALFYLNTLPE